VRSKLSSQARTDRITRCKQFERNALFFETKFGRLDSRNSFAQLQRVTGGLGTEAAGCEARLFLGTPYSGFLTLQAATISGLICGRGFVAWRGWGVPCMMGTMQSHASPLPSKARRS